MRLKKATFVLFVFCVIMSSCSNYVEAAINEDYYNKSISGLEVVDATLNDKVENDSFIDIIGHFVYSFASMAESLTGSIFQTVSGSNIFPWADAVVFNAIPLLDPNFINPADDSFLKDIGGIVRRLYGTVFGMATVFFGIAVMIVALKLLISTIAEEKAKFKQALVNWVIGLVLLYTIHFFMSFVFYINEKFVEMASSLVTWDAEMVQIGTNPMEDGEIILNLCDDSLLHEQNCREMFEDLSEDGRKVAVHLLRDRGYQSLLTKYLDQLTFSMSIEQVVDIIMKDVAAVLATNPNSAKYERYAVNGANYDVAYEEIGNYIYDTFNEYFPSGAVWYVATENEYNELKNSYTKAINGAWNLLYSEKTNNLFSNLAQYFKSSIWGYEDSSWKADKMIVQNAFLYATFIVQSIIFFVAYIKRLFYVVILGIMAPIVVVYNYVKKS